MISFLNFWYRRLFRPRLKAKNLFIFIDRIKGICRQRKVPTSLDNAEKIWSEISPAFKKYHYRDLLNAEDLKIIDRLLPPPRQENITRKYHHRREASCYIESLKNKIRELENPERMNKSIEKAFGIKRPGTYLLQKTYPTYVGKVGDWLIQRLESEVQDE